MNSFDYLSKFSCRELYTFILNYLDESAYSWNGNGYMTTDASRGITNIKYNHQGLPVQTRFSNGDMTVCSYDASGLLTQSVTMGRRFALRDYVADRVFSTGELLYSYFPGGYFDADGASHYLHTDYQGSVVMVTDSAGTIEQHTSYYPYGEPHRAPSGQPILYGGKERIATTDDYNFDARRYHAPTLLMSAPDPCATQFPHLSPFIYCAGNPIKYTDVTGRKFTESSGKLLAQYINELDKEKNKQWANFLKGVESLANGQSSKKVWKNMSHSAKVFNTVVELEGELETLKESSQMYDVAVDRSRNKAPNPMINRDPQLFNWTCFNFYTENVEIRLGDTSLSSFVHEFTHAYQFEVGDLSWSPHENGHPFNDKHDERVAYERGELFHGQNNRLDPLYKKLQNGPCSVATYEYGTAPETLQRFANQSQSVFRYNGVTYISDKLKKRK